MNKIKDFEKLKKYFENSYFNKLAIMDIIRGLNIKYNEEADFWVGSEHEENLADLHILLYLYFVKPEKNKIITKGIEELINKVKENDKNE